MIPDTFPGMTCTCCSKPVGECGARWARLLRLTSRPVEDPTVRAHGALYGLGRARYFDPMTHHDALAWFPVAPAWVERPDDTVPRAKTPMTVALEALRVRPGRAIDLEREVFTKCGHPVAGNVSLDKGRHARCKQCAREQTRAAKRARLDAINARRRPRIMDGLFTRCGHSAEKSNIRMDRDLPRCRTCDGIRNAARYQLDGLPKWIEA